MRYIKKLNETLFNIKYIKFQLNSLLDDFKKIGIEIDKRNTEVEKKDDSLKIIIRHSKFSHNKENLIINILSKTQTQLFKLNYYLSFKISKHFDVKILDDLSIEKTDVEMFTLYLYVKNLYTSRVKIPDIIYHNTMNVNIEKIREEGLKCSTSVNFTDYYLQYPPSIFFSEEKNGWYKGHECTVSISTIGLKNKFWIDPNLNVKGFYFTNEDIPKEYIIDISPIKYNSNI